MKRTIIIVLLITLMVFNAKSQAFINFSSDNVFPEGVAYDEGSGQFFISSIWKGQIGTLQKNGTYTVFYTHPKLISTLGMKINGNRLYVCNTDFIFSSKTSEKTKFKLAEIWVFDIKAKKLLHIYNLSDFFPNQRHMANDLTIDNKGNIYITDSMFPAIYKIDSKGKASVFVSHNELFNAEKTVFTQFSGENAGLNGIAYNKEGYIIAANYSKGLLIKIDLATKTVTRVGISTILKAADGILFVGQDLYVVVNGNLNRVFKLNSSDNFTYANVVAVDSTNYSFPTTITAAGSNRIYTVMSHLDKLGETPSPENKTVFSRDFSLKLYSGR